ncbi:MAG TPA: metallophosphoesterase, partial [Candidatus Saccharimonadales bacterium]|nr:metallophosphoesterase [Candidatus Saccharimonadales bacterium]
MDIVGDVHGEVGALLDLLSALGYGANGRHPAGRRLVFVGDLCDRGPDSVAVMELVGELVDRQLAQCVLGNHELNLLRASRKEGNGWYFDDDHDRQEGKFTTSRQASPASRAWINGF